MVNPGNQNQLELIDSQFNALSIYLNIPAGNYHLLLSP